MNQQINSNGLETANLVSENNLDRLSKMTENQKDNIELTGKPGAPIGNTNNSKGTQLTNMLQAALNKNDKQRLRDGIESVANAFADGERWAIEFVFDRTEGKAKQSIAQNITGEMLIGEIVRKVV